MPTVDSKPIRCRRCKQPIVLYRHVSTGKLAPFDPPKAYPDNHPDAAAHAMSEDPVTGEDVYRVLTNSSAPFDPRREHHVRPHRITCTGPKHYID